LAEGIRLDRLVGDSVPVLSLNSAHELFAELGMFFADSWEIRQLLKTSIAQFKGKAWVTAGERR
jgi:hypothetical protein